jgi:hypothetical protein
MSRLKKWLLPYLPWHFGDQLGSIESYAFEHGTDVRSHLRENYKYSGRLGEIFTGNKGNVVHKWHHYIPIYDRYFQPYVGKPVRFLEIGVSKGGSLQMWRDYFGEHAIIFGIDIDPACAKFDGQAGKVRIGSQTDETFLSRVIAEMGGVDVILDDGSHMMKHIPVTLKALFPQLAQGGLYMIEDLHTSYWIRFGGGYYHKRNFFHAVGQIVADMHHWYHRRNLRWPEVSRDCTAIHIHDSIVVLEKAKSFPPVHSQVG